MAERITFRVSQGTVQIETSGFVGSSCLEATLAIQKRLGGTVISDTEKPEMYEVPQEPEVSR